jgi:excisionase family DNA binding protein
MATATANETQARAGLATVEQAREFLAISRAHLYTLMDNGSLKYVKLGKSRRIGWDALYELAEKGAA